MNIIRPGTPVKIADGSITGNVLAFTLRGESLHLEYQVEWWNNGTRSEVWLQRHAVKPVRPAPGDVTAINLVGGYDEP